MTTYLIRFLPEIEVMDTTVQSNSKQIQRYLDAGYEIISELDYKMFLLIFSYSGVEIEKSLHNCLNRLTEVAYEKANV